jgi:hypothetical protein
MQTLLACSQHFAHYTDAGGRCSGGKTACGSLKLLPGCYRVWEWHDSRVGSLKQDKRGHFRLCRVCKTRGQVECHHERRVQPAAPQSSSLTGCSRVMERHGGRFRRLNKTSAGTLGGAGCAKLLEPGNDAAREPQAFLTAKSDSKSEESPLEVSHLWERSSCTKQSGRMENCMPK